MNRHVFLTHLAALSPAPHAALPAAPTQVGLATFQGSTQAERWVKFTAFRHGPAPQLNEAGVPVSVLG